MAESCCGESFRQLETNAATFKDGRSTLTMGKNKGQKNKDKKDKPFTVINTKKTKTKAVAKNLKNLTFQNKAKTEKADERFKSVQDMVVTTKTVPGKKGTEKFTPQRDVKQHKDTSADMDIATEDFAKL